jgi:hypothetical protein
VTALTDRLTARKITSIIAIDDENAFPVIATSDQLIDAIVFAKPIALRILADKDPRFKDTIDKRLQLADVAAEDRRTELRSDIQALIDTAKLGAGDYAQVATIVYHGHQGATARKLKVPFSEVPLQAVSFAQWEQRYPEILRELTPDQRLLLLVDERNEYEASITELNGRRLLTRLWREYTDQMPYVDTIILTSSCQPDEEFEESKRLVVALREGIGEAERRAKVRRAFVISKERLNARSIVGDFEMHLDRIAAGELRSQLADLTKQTLHAAVAEALQWLEDISLSDFHGSVFVSSQSEGSSELDTLLRLVSIHQRAGMEKEFASTAPLQQKIVQLRQFSLKHLDPDYAKASRAELRQLRQQEFERSGQLLNAMFTPLSCGDVFRFTETRAAGPSDRLAVLLANPCDLVLRSKGRRKAKRGWLVPLFKDTKANLQRELGASGDGSKLLYTLYTGAEDRDEGYLFTNSSVDAIDLDILDLCWTNMKGHATLDLASLAGPNGFILPAQKKRMEVLRQKAAADRFRDVELFGTEYRVTRRAEAEAAGDPPPPAGTTIEYPIERVFQLAPEFAAAALSSLSQSISRPAFGHDFMQVE